jgi:hypothetical protein
MARDSIVPKFDPEEAAVLEQLERVEAAVRAKPMPRVIERVRKLAEQLSTDRVSELRRQMREDLETIRRQVRESGEPVPSTEEIDAEIRAVRQARGTKAKKR